MVEYYCILCMKQNIITAGERIFILGVLRWKQFLIELIETKIQRMHRKKILILIENSLRLQQYDLFRSLWDEWLSQHDS